MNSSSNVPMTRPEGMLAEHKTNFFHSSTFAELDDGRILHAAGTRFTTSADGGITWSAPFSCVDTEGNKVGGNCTSLVRLDGKGVGLSGQICDETIKSFGKKNRTRHMVFWRSPDGGKTWEPPVRISPMGIMTQSVQDVLLRTSSGRIVLPVFIMIGQPNSMGDKKPPNTGKILNGQWVGTSAHFFGPFFTGCCAYYSDDDGRTWEMNDDGEMIILLDWSALYSYTNEPSVTEVYPGCLLMIMRNQLGRLYQAWSYNNGETWTRTQPTALAAATTPGQIRTLPTGHLLIVWNQENEEEVKQGYNRTRLSSAVSRNGGGVWEFFQNVESIHESTRVEPGPIRPVRPAETYYPPGYPAPEREGEYIYNVDFHGRWSYPSVFVMKDRVLITHTYSVYEEHPTRAEMILSNQKEGGFNQKLKVLPLNWFYGGKEPADNPFLPRAYEPAQP